MLLTAGIVRVTAGRRAAAASTPAVAPVLLMLLVSAVGIQATQAGRRASVGGAVVGRAVVRGVARVLLVFLVLLLFLVAEDICTNGAGNHASESAQGASAKLVA